jgi:hypothetical protein
MTTLAVARTVYRRRVSLGVFALTQESLLRTRGSQSGHFSELELPGYRAVGANRVLGNGHLDQTV